MMSNVLLSDVKVGQTLIPENLVDIPGAPLFVVEEGFGGGLVITRDGSRVLLTENPDGVLVGFARAEPAWYKDIPEGRTVAVTIKGTVLLPQDTVAYAYRYKGRVALNLPIVALYDLTDAEVAAAQLSVIPDAELRRPHRWFVSEAGTIAYGTTKFTIVHAADGVGQFAAWWGDKLIETGASRTLEELKTLCETKYVALVEVGLEK
jgi:hypothetical protein